MRRDWPKLTWLPLAFLASFVESLVRSLISPAFVAPPIAYFAFGTAAIGIAMSTK